MLLPRYSQIQSGCRVLFLPKNPTNPPVSASVEVTNICNSQENLKAVNDERDVGQIPATTYFKGEDMDFIEATPLPTECRCCQKTDCYNCDHASKRWTLSKKQELLLLRKLKEKAILRFKRQIEEIDYSVVWDCDPTPVFLLKSTKRSAAAISRSQRSFIAFHGALRNILLSAGFPAMFHMITPEQTFFNGPLQKNFSCCCF